jgi:hypothetical protein
MTAARPLRAYRLRDAIVGMVSRLCASERAFAFAVSSGDMPARDRHERAARRRYRAVLRLTAALRDAALNAQVDR